MVRFIDLGLLLLMAFLATVDLTPRVQVPLPYGTGSASAAVSFQIRVSPLAASVRREPDGTDICQVRSLPALAACLRTLRNLPTPMVLVPLGTATVQRLVRVMDLCEQERVACNIAPLL